MPIFPTFPVADAIEALDYETILDGYRDDFLAEAPEFTAEDLESDPVLKLLEVTAMGDLNLRSRYNDAVRAVLLPSAMGTALDNIGALVGVQRRVVRAADPDATPPLEAVFEDDESLRVRIWLAPEKLSVAGLDGGSYLAHSLDADVTVRDAWPGTPRRGDVEVLITSTEDTGLADATLGATVLAYLNPESRRPLSDVVRVRSAAITEYSFAAELTILDGPAGESALADVRTRVAAYLRTLDGQIAQSVTRDRLIGLMLRDDGAVSVDLTSPAADVTCTAGVTSQTNMSDPFGRTDALIEGQAPHCTNLDEVSATDATAAITFVVQPTV